MVHIQAAQVPYLLYINDNSSVLQDEGLKLGAVNNCIKTVKTFYHVNGAEVKLSEPPRTQNRLQRQGIQTRRNRTNDRQICHPRKFYHCSYSNRRIPRRNIRQTQIPTRPRSPRSKQNLHPPPHRSTNRQRKIPRLRRLHQRRSKPPAKTIYRGKKTTTHPSSEVV